MTDLAQLTGNRQWRRLANGAVALIGGLTRDGRDLPPDWAVVTGRGKLAPAPAPDGSEPQAVYGLGAQRTIPWFTFSCDQRARVRLDGTRPGPLQRRPGQPLLTYSRG